MSFRDVPVRRLLLVRFDASKARWFLVDARVWSGELVRRQRLETEALPGDEIIDVTGPVSSIAEAVAALKPPSSQLALF